MTKRKSMIGDVKDIWGRYLPNGTLQENVNIGIMSETGSQQEIIFDDGSRAVGTCFRSFLDSDEICVPPSAIRDAPKGQKPNPNPKGAAHSIGSKAVFAKSYLLDKRYGSPRQLDPSGKTVNNFGPAIVTGRGTVMIGGINRQVWMFRISDTLLEWCSPV